MKTDFGPLEIALADWISTYDDRQGLSYGIEDFKALQSSEGHVLLSRDFDEKFDTGNSLHLNSSKILSKKVTSIKTKC